MWSVDNDRETTQYIYIIVSVKIIDRNKIALKAFCHMHALSNCVHCASPLFPTFHSASLYRGKLGAVRALSVGVSHHGQP